MKHSITVILDDTVTNGQVSRIAHIMYTMLVELGVFEKSTLKTEIVLEKRTDDKAKARRPAIAP